MKTIPITINNKEYDIDLEKAQELGVLKPVEKYPKINRGIVLLDKSDDALYLLAMVDYNKFALLTMTDGNRYQKPSHIENFNYISEREKWEGLGLDPDKWKVVGPISNFKNDEHE